MSAKRPLSILIAALLIIAIHTMSGVMGVVALLLPASFSTTHYPQLLNIAFVMVNGPAVFAGVTLLQMKRVGVWMYGLVVVPAFLLLSFVAEQQISLGYSRYIGGLVMFAFFALLTLPHWLKLDGAMQKPEAVTNA